MDNEGKTSLAHAIEKGYHEIVASLLEGGAIIDLDENGKFPLTVAIERNAVEVVEVLLMLRGDALVDLQDSNGRSPLSIAIHYRNFHIV